MGVLERRGQVDLAAEAVEAQAGGEVGREHLDHHRRHWVMGLAADKRLFEAPIRNTILIAGLAGAAATLLSMLLAIWSARSIARPIEQIEQGTLALMHRKAIRSRTPACRKSIARSTP